MGLTKGFLGVLCVSLTAALGAMSGCQACGAPVATSEPCGAGKTQTATMYIPGGGCAICSCSILRVDKSAPDRVSVGQPFDYNIKVTNVAKAKLYDVALYDTDVTNFKVTKADPEPASSDSGRWMWKLGDLAPGESRTIAVTGNATGVGTLNSCAEVTFRSEQLCLNIEAVQPMLALTETAPSDQLLCDVIPLKFVVKNNGTGAACNVVVNSDLPKGWSTLDGKETLMFTGGTLNAGEEKEFQAQVRTTKTGTFASQGIATADGGLRADAGATTIVVKPELSTAIHGPDERYIGVPVKYEIVVMNGPEIKASNSMLNYQLPPGTSFISASDNGQYDNGRVTWNLGDLNPRDERKVSVTIKANQEGTIKSLASVNASCGAASADTSTQIKGIPAILLEMVDLVDPVEIGQNTTYRITVTNQGSTADNQIVVDCAMPTSQKYISSTGPTQASIKGNQITFGPLPTLAPGAKATWDVVVQALEPCDCRFEVKLTSAMLSGPPVMKTESTHQYK